MNIDTAKARFKNYLESGGYAASTIECYCIYLGYFLDYLREITIMDLKQVTHETIRNYQLLITNMDIAEETKGMRLRPVKRLFGWLLDTHRLLLDPTEKIKETNRKNRTLPPVLTIEEMRLLLDQPNLSLRMQIRDRAIMETLYSSGIRLNELVQLTVHDVDLKDKVLQVRKGKGNRQRVVPIGRNATKYLKEYLQEIRPRYAMKNKQERRVFLTDQGEPVTGNTIRTALFHYKKAAGIEKTASPLTASAGAVQPICCNKGRISAMSRSCLAIGTSGLPRYTPGSIPSTSRKPITGRIHNENQGTDTGIY